MNSMDKRITDLEEMIESVDGLITKSDELELKDLSKGWKIKRNEMRVLCLEARQERLIAEILFRMFRSRGELQKWYETVDVFKRRVAIKVACTCCK